MGLASVLVVVAAGCGSSSDGSSGSASGSVPGSASGSVPGSALADPVALPVPVQALDITGSEYRFDIEPGGGAGLRPGWTVVRFRNVGEEAHQVMFARVKDGVDMAEMAAAGAGDSSGATAIEFVDMIGGVSYIGPGREITALVDLPAGTVLAMCYVPDAQGVAHALHGMTTLLAVSPDAAASPGAGTVVPVPGDGEVRGTIELADGGYVLPESLGTGWYRVVNTDVGEPGTGLHELSIMRLGRSVTAEEVDGIVADIAANATPSVELDALGGLGAVSPGFEGYLYLDLPPGEYLAVDFMPDARDPRPHLLDGYHATFGV